MRNPWRIRRPALSCGRCTAAAICTVTVSRGRILILESMTVFSPHVQVQEKPELVTRLALYRLYWPWDLTEKARESYWKYIKEHMRETVLGLAARGELEILRWLSDAGDFGKGR